MSDPDLDLVSRQRQLRELVSRLAEQSPHEAIPRIATPRFIIPSLVFWHGRLFTPARLPADIERGRSQDCYRNALFLTIEHPGWTYAEGYGLVEDGAVPHAWPSQTAGWSSTKRGPSLSPKRTSVSNSTKQL